MQTTEKLNFSANQCRIQRNKSAVSAQAYRIESRRFLQEELRKIIPSRVGRELISTHLSMLRMEVVMLLLILLVILIFGFGYGGYRTGPGYGYYGGDGISLILTIVLTLLLTKVI